VRTRRNVTPWLVVVLMILVGVQLAIAARSGDQYEWIDPIIDVRNLVVRNFVEEPDQEAMQRAMITAMVDALEDPYTMYVPPADEADFNKALLGTYVGIGAEVTEVDGYLTIVTPLEDSPALAAGVMAGDTVLEIEGVSTLDLTANECVDRLLGEPNTPVTIRVRHPDGVEQEITIVRQRIVTRSVKGFQRVGEDWDFRIDPASGIGYIRVTQFVEDTVPNLEEALASLLGTGLEGLILDLRFNGGGTLASAIGMANLFLDEGRIVSVDGRRSAGRGWDAMGDGTLPDFPMVVLINQGSASASEIVSGALQDHDRAKILGTRSFGKGSVQEVHALPDGGGTLKLTTGRYYLPSGRNLDRGNRSSVWGVDPDPGFHLKMNREEYIAMNEARRRFEIIDDEDPDASRWSEPEWIRSELHDAQLAAALEAVQARVGGEPWPVVGGEGGTEAALDEELDQALARRDWYAGRIAEADTEIARMMGFEDELAGGPPDLVPDDAKLVGGTIAISDSEGNVIATLRITDRGDLERALRDAPVEPVGAGGS
jgi:carboxyl-terminal processing protease